MILRQVPFKLIILKRKLRTIFCFVHSFWTAPLSIVFCFVHSFGVDVHGLEGNLGARQLRWHSTLECEVVLTFFVIWLAGHVSLQGCMLFPHFPKCDFGTIVA